MNRLMAYWLEIVLVSTAIMMSVAIVRVASFAFTRYRH